MRRFLLIAAYLVLSLPATAQDSEECNRPPTQELAEYKEAYIPQAYSFESFRWEIADVALLAVLLSVASLLSVRHHPKCRFTEINRRGFF